MGFFGDVWNGIKDYGPGVLGGPIADAEFGGGHLGGDYLNERAPGQTSDIPDANRSNFDLPYGDDMRRRDQNLGDAYGRRSAPEAGQSAFAGDQRALVDRLRRQMSGEDSLSQLQLRDATDSNIAQQRSLAAGAAPGNAAMAQRLAMQGIGRMNQGYGAQAAQLGIQERNAAANALGSVAGMARGQDQQNNQFNVGAALQQTGLNDQAQNHAYDRGLQTAGMQQQGGMSFEQQQTQRRGQDLGQPLQPTNLDRLTSAAGAIAPYALASDQRLKTNIHPAGGEVDSLIARLRPTEYEYRDPRLGTGPRVGIIAQDVERGGPAGRAMVSEVGGPGGAKMLDVPASLGTALAAIGRLGERLDAMEGHGAVAARTKQTARTGPAPAPRAAELEASLHARPEELSRSRRDMRMVRPEELSRDRQSSLVDRLLARQ
jgi:hypothetical protein